jgi:antirestriction protein ArdC
MSKAKEIYEKIVEEFKEDLKKGINPFKIVAQPMNGNTLRPYGGFNRLHLARRSKELGSETSLWLTMKQINALDGKVIKGSKSTPVFMYGFTFKFRKNVAVSAYTLNDAVNLAKKKNASITGADFLQKIPFMKMYLVFELSQTENIELEYEKQSDDFETLVNECGAVYTEKGILPSYDTNTDTIDKPELSKNDRYLLFGALCEWTSHSDRLDRNLEYAEEKLVAQIATAFLCQSTDVEMINFDDTQISVWLERLDKNPHFLYKAAGLAEKSTNFILEQVASACNIAA